ncbi:MAG TPA: hypothetical protein VK909_00285 [Anaerolineales bacterium]|nr:hypothetical protein [Anaerolineales bacterium]
MVATNFTTPKNNDRLTQLWEDLLAEPVPPHPAAKEWKAAGACFEMNSESVLFLGIDELKSTSRPWRVDLAKMFHSLLETVDAELPSPAPGEVISEADGFSNTSAVAAHEAALALSSPFHWEPKPAWINAPVRSGSSTLNPAGPQRFVARPKIPLRPLHKQPLYMRILFCLRRWLSRKSKIKV